MDEIKELRERIDALYADEGGATVRFMCALSDAWPTIRQALTSTAGEKDAERYRWLREQCTPFSDWKVSKVLRANASRPERIWLHSANLDAAIDAAIASSSKDDQAGEQAPSGDQL